MVNHNMAHPTGLNPPVPFHDPQAIAVNRLRVALLPQIAGWVPAPAIRRALQEAAEALRQQGAVVEEWADHPDTHEGTQLFFGIVASDGFSFVSQILAGEKPIPLMAPNAQLTGMPNMLIPILSALLARSGQRRTSQMLQNARKQSAAGLTNLLGDRLRYEGRFAAALSSAGYDAILCPALPLPAVRHLETNTLADFWSSMLLFNVLGFPAGVAPITRVRPGEESDRPDSSEKSEQSARTVEQGSVGLPAAVQIAAPHWREDVVLALLGALESQFRGQPDFPAHPPL